MSFMDKAKKMAGKAMRPIHAGDDKLVLNSQEIAADRMPRRIEVHSDAFDDNGVIPVKYSGEGQDVSPPLRWSGVPAEAREVVVLCEDPDAPMTKPFLHWLMRGLSPQVDRLPEGVSKMAHPSEIDGAEQGENGRHNTGYMGPIPPQGHGVHHYHFEVFALDQPLADGIADRDALKRAMAGHVIAYGEVVGTYERK